MSDIVKHMTNLPNPSEIVKRLTNPLADRPLPIGDLMRQAQQRLAAFLDGSLRDAGYADVRAAHVSVLATIDIDGSRLTALVERGGRTKQATAQVATHLLDRGYIGLAPDPLDGRAKLYTLTDRGWRLLDAASMIVTDYERWLNEIEGPDAIARLRQTLTLIIDEGSGAVPPPR
jgi:DNA-binding MarR family transcriptional regulator